jgi:hypothetical protein
VCAPISVLSTGGGPVRRSLTTDAGGASQDQGTNEYARPFTARLTSGPLAQFLALPGRGKVVDPCSHRCLTTVSRMVESSRMMTSQVLHALEGKKLILRDHHPSDRRARALRATAAGILIAQHATHDVEHADRIFFAPLREKTGTFVTELTLLVFDTKPPATDNV